MPLRSDPGRLPRRNHHQEGPGFLFLATQGGRPPETPTGVDTAKLVRRRAAALRRWDHGEAATVVAADLGVRRATLYRWRERYAERGLAGLVDQPRLDRASELEPVLERLIITVRLLTNWNSRRIAAEFGRRGVPLGHSQVDRLLARYGTHRSSITRTPGPRYERSAPNELWHIDLEGAVLPASAEWGAAHVPLHCARRRSQPLPGGHPRRGHQRGPGGARCAG